MKIFADYRDATHLYNKSKFPAGEINISANIELIYKRYSILTSLKSSDDIIELCLLKNALDNEIICTRDAGVGTISNYVHKSLQIGYLPYARQDRICNKYEAFSLKVIAEIINNLNFDSVTLIDPHSEVATALINNSRVINKDMIFHGVLEQYLSSKDTVLCSPDAGAFKEISKIGLKYKKETICCTKHRNLKTGEITNTTINGCIKDKTLVIVDDICDGGRTFIEIAKIAKSDIYNAKEVVLFVTHGIFSKGFEELSQYIDKVYTTDTYFTKEDYPKDLIEVINIEEF